MKKCLHECFLNGTLIHKDLFILPIVATHLREILKHKMFTDEVLLEHKMFRDEVLLKHKMFIDEVLEKNP